MMEALEVGVAAHRGSGSIPAQLTIAPAPRRMSIAVLEIAMSLMIVLLGMADAPCALEVARMQPSVTRRCHRRAERRLNSGFIPHSDNVASAVGRPTTQALVAKRDVACHDWRRGRG